MLIFIGGALNCVGYRTINIFNINIVTAIARFQKVKDVIEKSNCSLIPEIYILKTSNEYTIKKSIFIHFGELIFDYKLRIRNNISDCEII